MNITRRAALMGAVALTIVTPVMAQDAVWGSIGDRGRIVS